VCPEECCRRTLSNTSACSPVNAIIVMRAAEITRSSPLIGPRVPVHGLMVDIESGRLEFVVNGYQTIETVATRWNEVVHSAGQTVDALRGLADFEMGEMRFPETKIGEVCHESWGLAE